MCKTNRSGVLNGSGGDTVASDSRGLWFESNHWHTLYMKSLVKQNNVPVKLFVLPLGKAKDSNIQRDITASIPNLSTNISLLMLVKKPHHFCCGLYLPT